MFWRITEDFIAFQMVSGQLVHEFGISRDCRAVVVVLLGPATLKPTATLEPPGISLETFLNLPYKESLREIETPSCDSKRPETPLNIGETLLERA